jgi:hypothetical protein
MYLVRTKDTKQLVGVFAATNPAELFNIVDEELDPFSCEFFEMQSGDGLFMDGQFVTHTDIEEVTCVTIEPTDVLHSSGIRMTEQLDLAIPDLPNAWHSFTKHNLAAAFGLPLAALDNPKVMAVFQGQLGIYAPESMN